MSNKTQLINARLIRASMYTVALAFIVLSNVSVYAQSERRLLKGMTSTFIRFPHRSGIPMTEVAILAQALSP